MERANEYLGILVTLLLSAGIAGAILFLNRILGPKRAVTGAKADAFECGLEPLSRPTGHLGVKFYPVAMLFILFDVEIVWLFPWAVLLRERRWTGIIEMFAFLAVFLAGFGYAWKKGALEWEK